MGWQDDPIVQQAGQQQAPQQMPTPAQQTPAMPSASQPIPPQRMPNLQAATQPQSSWESDPIVQQTQQTPPDQQRGMLSGLGHAALSGIPVIGPLAEKGISKVYPENERLQEDFEQQHPIASTAASVGGGVAAMLATGGTSLGARLLGLTGSLPGMIARGATSGATIGAADALTRGQDPSTGALYGGVGGAAGPVLGRAVSTVAAPFVNTARGALNPAAEASRVVAGGLTADAGRGLADLNASPAARVMDLGDETTRGIMRSAANNSPEARRVLNAAIDPRFEAQSSRLEDWINSRFNFPDAASQQAALDQAAKGPSGVGTRYDAAYNASDNKFSQGIRFDQTPELARLSQSEYVQAAMSKAAKQARGRFFGEGYGGTQNPFGNAADLQNWDYTYRNLRDMGNAAYRQGLNNEGSFITAQAKALRGELDSLVPEFGQARSTAESFFNAGDALEAGQNFANTGKPDIEGARQAIADMNMPERKLFQDGYLSQMIQNARASGDRRNWIATLNSSPVRRQAMDMALGASRSQELQGFLHVENVMDRARGAVQSNSTTARQLMEMGLAGGVGSTFENGNPLTDPSAFMRDAILYGGLRYGHGRIQARVAEQVAQLLTSRDQAAVNRGMQLVTRNRNLFGAIQNADAALGSIGTRTAAQAANRPPQALPAQ